MPADQGTETCRCGCGEPATEHGIAAFQCWTRVLPELRRDVYSIDKYIHPRAYKLAVDEVAAWLKQNPRFVTVELPDVGDAR